MTGLFDTDIKNKFVSARGWLKALTKSQVSTPMKAQLTARLLVLSAQPSLVKTKLRLQIRMNENGKL